MISDTTIYIIRYQRGNETPKYTGCFFDQKDCQIIFVTNEGDLVLEPQDEDLSDTWKQALAYYKEIFPYNKIVIGCKQPKAKDIISAIWK